MKNIDNFMEDDTLYTPVFCTMQKGEDLKNIVVLMANFTVESQCDFVSELGRRHGVFAISDERYSNFRMDFGKYLMMECLSFDWWQGIEYIYDCETGAVEVKDEDFEIETPTPEPLIDECDIRLIRDEWGLPLIFAKYGNPFE